MYFRILSGPVGGAHCTPVKQKMKTMSRSLQMLNVARLNVKAQKNQTDCDPIGSECRGSDRPGRRRCSERSKSGGRSTVSECPKLNVYHRTTLLSNNVKSMTSRSIDLK